MRHAYIARGKDSVRSAHSLARSDDVGVAARDELADGRRATSTTYPQNTACISAVRAGIRSLLAGCPLADDVILCASELAANSALHSYSAKPGGQFTVRAAAGRQAWIAVDDNRGPSINPALRGGPSPARVMGSTSSAPSPPHGTSRVMIATGPSVAVRLAAYVGEEIPIRFPDLAITLPD